MRTPSLNNRIAALGAAIVAVVLIGVNVVVYVTFRTQLLHSLDPVLQERLELVRQLAVSHSDQDLAIRLGELGLQATVRSRDGAVYQAGPPSRALDNNLSDPAGDSTAATISRQIQLSDGSTVTVFARRSGVDDASENLLVLEGAGLLVAALLTVFFLRRTSDLALRPLQQMAASARRTARGHRGERLQPDRPGTTLGELATAYDEMLESLEASESKAGEAQIESELLYLHLRQVIETADAAYVAIDASGVITDWNTKAEEVFGWHRSAAVGRSLADTLIPPDLRAAHTAGLRRFTDTGEHRLLGRNVEFEALHRDGHLIPVEIATWVTFVGEEVTFNGFLRDISERRKGEEAIGRLASIVESAQEAICASSLDGTIISWNFGAEHAYGYTAEEAIGQNVSLIIPADRRDEIEMVRRQIERAEPVTRYETVRRRKDGSDVEVAVTCSPIFDPWGAVTGVSTIARDITEQRRVAATLELTMAALERAVADARHSEERSLRFLADAAHQLRSPIAGVRACAETLLRGTHEGDSDRLLANLVREASRAGRLVTVLLRLARIDQGVAPEPASCDVAAICTSEVERIRLLAPQLQIALEISEPDRGPEIDGGTLSEILSNLLDNARRHAKTMVEVRVAPIEGILHVHVMDDGSGVPQDSVGRLFDRFVSLDGMGGSGLGLAIARALARVGGGDLTYRAGRGGGNAGSTFALTLPLQPQVPDDHGIRNSNSAATRVQLRSKTP